MGCCEGLPLPTIIPDGRTAFIQKNINVQMQNQAKIYKLLLLGTGGSGKSTLFKQLRSIHEGGISQQELHSHRHSIRCNCVSGILLLLQKSEELADDDIYKYKECAIDMTDERIIACIRNVVSFATESFTLNINDETITDAQMRELSDSIAFLWSLEAIQATYNLRHKYSFSDNMDYFYHQIETIMDAHFCPTEEDLLKVQLRSTGLTNYSYENEGIVFHIVDVGGQRNERKKWIHCFDGVTAVLFVAALNHFYAVLFEDERKNAMLEAIELFEEICNSKWFHGTNVILFLNKVDLFTELLRKGISISECFAASVGWTGDAWDGVDYDPTAAEFRTNAEEEEFFDTCLAAALEFIRYSFEQHNFVESRTVFVHIVCATNRDTIKKVFFDVQHTVTEKHLFNAGMV